MIISKSFNSKLTQPNIRNNSTLFEEWRNYTKDMFLGVPLTSTQRDGSFFFQFEFDGEISIALLVQHKLFSSKRIIKKMGKINSEDFKNLKKKLIELIE